MRTVFVTVAAAAVGIAVGGVSVLGVVIAITQPSSNAGHSSNAGPGNAERGDSHAAGVTAPAANSALPSTARNQAGAPEAVPVSRDPPQSSTGGSAPSPTGGSAAAPAPAPATTANMSTPPAALAPAAAPAAPPPPTPQPPASAASSSPSQAGENGNQNRDDARRGHGSRSKRIVTTRNGAPMNSANRNVPGQDPGSNPPPQRRDTARPSNTDTAQNAWDRDARSGRPVFDFFSGRRFRDDRYSGDRNWNSRYSDDRYSDDVGPPPGARFGAPPQRRVIVPPDRPERSGGWGFFGDRWGDD